MYMLSETENLVRGTDFLLFRLPSMLMVLRTRPLLISAVPRLASPSCGLPPTWTCCPWPQSMTRLEFPFRRSKTLQPDFEPVTQASIMFDTLCPFVVCAIK